MSKSELIAEIRASIDYQMQAANDIYPVDKAQYSAWCQRAQVLAWALARLERLDSLE